MNFTLILFLIGTLGAIIFRKYLIKSLQLPNSGDALKFLIPNSLLELTMNI